MKDMSRWLSSRTAATLIAFVLAAIYVARSQGILPSHPRAYVPRETNNDRPAYIPQPTNTIERASDVQNTFADLQHADDCSLNSLDLHMPIEPLCRSRSDVLDAMSFGGRAGIDQPYIPRGCDFRWYDTSEICTILGRFSHIFIIGDSLQRMLVTAFFMLLRNDVGLGGVAEWVFGQREAHADQTTDLNDCMCEDQFRRHECSHSYVKSYSELVRKTSSQSGSVCGGTGENHLPFELSYLEWQGSSPSDSEKESLLSALPPANSKPSKPYAFVMHHTFWSEVNATATLEWVDAMESILTGAQPFLPKPSHDHTYAPNTPGFARLFVTANAPGSLENQITFKNREAQNVARFERAIRPHLAARDIDLLGFYNMSVQTSSNDNVHANMRTNLLKAMMVMNWLDWAGREEAPHWG